MVYRMNDGTREVRGPLMLRDTGRVYVEFRPDLDYETIRGQAGVPALVTRGIFRGFSLPVYDTDFQELYCNICVPGRWDGSSNIFLHLDCWLPDANNAKKFQMRVAWEHYAPGSVVPATSTDEDVETTTGNDAAFMSHQVEFEFAYGDLAADDIIQFRIRCIAASIDEIAGAVVVCHLGVVFQRDKMGIAIP